MRTVNPAVIPRNHRVEEALSAAEERDDLSVLHRLLAALASPYEARAELAGIRTRPPTSAATGRSAGRKRIFLVQGTVRSPRPVENVQHVPMQDDPPVSVLGMGRPLGDGPDQVRRFLPIEALRLDGVADLHVPSRPLTAVLREFERGSTSSPDHVERRAAGWRGDDRQFAKKHT